MRNTFSRRQFLQSAAVLGAIASDAPRRAFAESQKPNIILFLADDMGWTAPACCGSDLHETPNIDRLAREGTRFSCAYTPSPVCTPTRAAIMTGKHPARLNMTIWRESAVSRLTSEGKEKLIPPVTETDLALDYVTLAETLREQGYHTLHVGKWHLGDAGHYPETQGFDTNIGGTIYGAPKTYWYPYRGANKGSGGIKEYRYIPGLSPGKPGDYLTDRLTSDAIAAVEPLRHEPFFLQLAFHSPHTPIEGKPEFVEHYRSKIREGMTHQNAEYAAMVHALDQNVGRVLQKLDEWGIADNTLVIFTSDNGGYDNVLDGQQVTNNRPLRSGKGSLYEGGVRVPLIMRYPNVAAANAVCDRPVVSMDFYATILELLGIQPSESLGVQDGLSLMPLLKDPLSKLERDTFYWHFPHYYFNTSPVSAIREGEWKLLEYFEDNHLELYNLTTDMGETSDLAKTDPERAKTLHAKLVQWRENISAKLPERRRGSLGT